MAQTPEQTALIALQSELENTRGQLLGLGQRFDSLAQAHTALQQTLQQANDTLRADTGNAASYIAIAPPRWASPSGRASARFDT